MMGVVSACRRQAETTPIITQLHRPHCHFKAGLKEDAIEEPIILLLVRGPGAQGY